MPEMTDLLPVGSPAGWDNLTDNSGCGDLERRSYYYKTCPDGCIVIVSAVQRGGLMHATDYLRICPGTVAWDRFLSLLTGKSDRGSEGN